MPLSESFPSAPEAGLLLLAGFLLQLVMGAVLHDFRTPLGLSQGQTEALVTLLSNGFLLTWVVHYRGSSHRDLLHPSSSSPAGTFLLLVPPVLLLVPGVMLVSSLLISGVEYVLPLSAWEEQAFARMTAGSLAAVVSTCVLAPLLEEMLFRGVLLRGFLVQYPRWAAISFSSLFFGAAHLNVYQFVFAFTLGLLLGWLYERSRSLIPCIALHAACNIWTLAVSQRLEGAGDSAAAVPLSSGLPAAGAALLGLLVLRRLLSRTAHTSETDTASP